MFNPETTARRPVAVRSSGFPRAAASDPGTPTLECELIDRRSWQTKTEARLALFTYIEGWYNPRRRHRARTDLASQVERSHLGEAIEKSRFIEKQIAYALRLAESGTPVVDVCRHIGVSEATYYTWKKKYADLGMTELRRLKMLEDENS